MTVLVIGAHGGIGRRFCEHAAEAGLSVRAMVRHPSQEEFFRQLGHEAVVGDLEGDFSHAFDGCDQVIFTAGSGPHTGPDKTLMVDLYGAIRAADLATEKGLDRFIMISALRADAPMEAPEQLRPYMAAKYAADFHLRHAGVPWLILKPGRLTDEPGTGRVALERDKAPDITVSRDNVARALLAVVQKPELRECEIRLLDGDQPVEKAI